MKPTQDPNMKFERMKASMCPFFGVGVRAMQKPAYVKVDVL